MKFLDLFSGIGGFRLALERAGHECVGFCEIDKYARQTYKANFNTEREVEWHDITSVTDAAIQEIGYVDIITGGFPCQSFSVAGKRGGFEDTRGTLFFEIARIAKQIEPRYLLLENVKGLLSHDEGRTFGTILNTLDELGYDAEWQVLNSKNFGVPQSRPRVFVVAHFRGEPRREVFPIEGSDQENNIKIIGDLGRYNYETMNRIYSVQGISPCIHTMQGGGREPKILDTKNRHCREVPQAYDICPALQASDYKEPKKVITTIALTEKRTDEAKQIRREHQKQGRDFSPRRGKVLVPRGDQTANCVTATVGMEHLLLTAQDRHKVPDGYRIRKLTPLECFRLQGFPDSHHDNAKAAGISDSQLYKQAGNAVTVNVVYEIARRLR